jgi:hypothetical protein
LKAAWLADAKLKDPGFMWDGSSYTKGRAGAADVQGLLAHSRPLTALLKLAPSGFPSHGLLRQALLELHTSERIFERVGADNAWKVATEAADLWRVMCKHVYNVSKSTNIPTSLVHLCGLIKHAETTRSHACPAAPGPSEPATPRGGATFPSFDEELADPEGNDEAEADVEIMEGETVDCDADAMDESDVELVSQFCMCPDCVKKRGPIAIEDVEVPSCRRGGQRQETQKPVNPRMRITKKTSVPDYAETKMFKNKTKDKPRPKMKVMKAMKAKVKASGAIALPVSMISRSRRPSRCAEAYVMQRTADGKQKFVAGQSEKQSASYIKNVRDLVAQITNKKITTVEDAKSFLEGRSHQQ